MAASSDLIRLKTTTIAVSDQMDSSGRHDIAPLQYVEQIPIAELVSPSANLL
jgi:hypothetical protein